MFPFTKKWKLSVHVLIYLQGFHWGLNSVINLSFLYFLSAYINTDITGYIVLQIQSTPPCCGVVFSHWALAISWPTQHGGPLLFSLTDGKDLPLRVAMVEPLLGSTMEGTLKHFWRRTILWGFIRAEDKTENQSD